MANSNTTLDNSTLALPVKHLVKRAPLWVEASATVAQAAQAMQTARVGSILISMAPPGIVTDRDLRGRVLAASLGAETSVSQIMTRPVKTIDADAPTFAALRLMLEENIHHLPVTEEGKIVGVVSATDLLFQQRKSPVYLRGCIESLDDSAEAANYAEEIGQLVSSLFISGLAAIHISQIVSSLNDALLRRLVALAVAKLGDAPTQFAWIVFGSEGRLEQTLLTDQDNALIYAEESDSAVTSDMVRFAEPGPVDVSVATGWCLTRK